MQLGHVPLALSIATFDWSPRTALICLGMHFLPNADSLVERSGLVGPKFHCTVTHTTWFAVTISAIVAIWSPHYAVFTFVAIMTHFFADLGSTVGIPFFWPFVNKRYTLALFKDTGYWGKEMYVGYYKQPMSWMLESAVTIFFVYRLFQIGVLGTS
jgi:membrane-bound metal-dependent hydrolase YbcI (DUF457 family)